MKKSLIFVLFVFLTYCGISQNDNSFVKECELPNEIREDIYNRRKWPNDDKNTIKDFLEEYICAYLNKRIDYLQTDIFSHGFDETETKNVRLTKKHAKEYLEKYSRCCVMGDITDFVISDFDMIKSNNFDGYYSLWFKQQYITQKYVDEGIYVLIIMYIEKNKYVIHNAMMCVDKEDANPINIRSN